MKEIEIIGFPTDSVDPNEQHSHLTGTFLKVVNKHGPLKKDVLKGNQAPSINKEMRKAIYTRSMLRNKFWENSTLGKERLYKSQRNKCVSLHKKCVKAYCKKVADNGIAANKAFWKFIKPFLTKKSFS